MQILKKFAKAHKGAKDKGGNTDNISCSFHTIQLCCYLKRTKEEKDMVRSQFYWLISPELVLPQVQLEN